MTAYHGGKQRIGGKISGIIAELYEDLVANGIKIRGYCEPFCGMCGVYKHIPDALNSDNLDYLAGDINPSLILMWSKFQMGWKPNMKHLLSMNEKIYNGYKSNNKSSALKGFVGHAFGFGGIYFGSFRPKYDDRSFVEKYVSNITGISKKLNRVKFKSGNYNHYSSLKNYIIYCDPPYDQTRCKYSSDSNHLLKFDHNGFIDWCVRMSKHNVVLVSSYNNITHRSFKKVWRDPKAKRISYRGRTNSYVESLYLVHT